MAKKDKKKVMKAVGVAGIGIAAGGLMSANSVYAAEEKQADTATLVSHDQITVKDQALVKTDVKSTDNVADTSETASQTESANKTEAAEAKTAETKANEGKEKQETKTEAVTETRAEASEKTDEKASDNSENQAEEKKETESLKSEKAENKNEAKSEEKAEEKSDAKAEKKTDVKTTVEKTEEKVTLEDGIKKKTETYTHHKITTSEHDEEPTEEEKKANLSSDGREPYIKHVKETTDESWTETKTTETKTVKTKAGEKMTNEDDYDSKNVYVVSKSGEAEKATESRSQSVKNFYDAQNVTSDFAVYAKSLDGTIGHEDGNIAVENLNKGTTIMNKDGQYAGNRTNGITQHDIDQAYAENGYSYIGRTNDGDYISSSSNFSRNGKNASLVVYGTDEGDSHEDTDGTANHFNSIHLKNGKEIPEEYKERTANLNTVIKFDENLQDMASSGQKAIEDTGNELSDIENLRAANNILKAGRLGNSDILSITLSSSVLKNDWLAGDYNEINSLLTGLVNSNTNHVNVLINVKIRASDLNENNELSRLGAMMNGINNYDCRASYLTWNFGSFNGTISMYNTMSGNFIAPNATLNVGGLESGRAVSNSFSHNGEIHMAVKGTSNVQYKTETETAEKTSESEHTSKTASSVSYDYKDTTAKPTEPTKPAEPTEPAKPTEPTNPSVPTKPAEPTVPTKPAEPANSVKPTKPAVPDKPADNHETAKEEKGNSKIPTQNEKNNSESKVKKTSEESSKTIEKNKTDTEKTVIPALNNNKGKTIALSTDEKEARTVGTYNEKTSEGSAVFSTAKTASDTGAPQTGDATSIFSSAAGFISSGGILSFLMRKRHHKR